MLNSACARQRARLGTIRCEPPESFVGASNISASLKDCNNVPLDAEDPNKSNKYQERVGDSEDTGVECIMAARRWLQGAQR